MPRSRTVGHAPEGDQPIRFVSVLFFHHPSSRRHDPRALAPDHPDSPERVAAIEAALGVARPAGLRQIAAPAATRDELMLAHSAAHIDFIRSLCESGGGRIDDDTTVGEASYDAALHAAGGACALVRTLAADPSETGFCALRPAGHHADRDRAMGFCLFNNVAIAAELAVRELGVERVLIVDWDVHHGNGTAEIFRRRADVMVAGIHQAGLFPGTGALTDTGSGEGRGFTVNVPVPAGSDDEVWLSVLEYVIVPIGREFRPGLILISAGYDAHRDDPLGDCRLDTAAYAQMACHVRDLGAELGAPVGAVLEGGYNLEALADGVLATVRALAGEGEADSIAPDPIVTPRVASHFGHVWAL
ncbi:MAG TPA: histone deacetylase [Solirubrobacteraceae bacterium]|nr:histone deacetylase [Solirubrobacteraceae bacterium]